jgi:hypothetical protein
MKYIKTILTYILRKDGTKPMGRWRREENHLQINYKIDLSNEDHCGPCGQYALSKIETSTTQKTERIATEQRIATERTEIKK